MARVVSSPSPLALTALAVTSLAWLSSRRRDRLYIIAKSPQFGGKQAEEDMECLSFGHNIIFRFIAPNANSKHTVLEL